MIQTEFEFTLPKGYVDGDGNLHRKGVMRLSRAIDEIVPMRDPRVRSNPAYATVIILARVITKLGGLEEISSTVIENLFASDLSYLQKFYRQINELEDTGWTGLSEETENYNHAQYLRATPRHKSSRAI